jgi:flagellar biosynthesis/type III secretory pathway chaperone
MPQIESLVADLIETLDQEHVRLDALRHLLMREQEAVRRWSAETLSAVTASKLEILQDLRCLEERRAALMSELGATWARSPESLTLKDIAARVGSTQGRKLLQQRETMRTDVQDALVIQDVTRSILTHAMTLCDEIMRSARETPGSGTLYSDAGMATAGHESKTWLNRRG